MDARTQAKARPFQHIVIPRYTDFKVPESGPNVPIHDIYEKLIADESRNELIFDDLLRELDRGRSERCSNMLADFSLNPKLISIITGQDP
ncbi:hypothetical protein skT53_20740 [Effusibacillus dendaii]|uniref:Uncharacterized protein n=1 Tax=Effusibacillus dendaii TaxID=2743772 RepID=A0A7I8DDQ3_9BACL|nr:hypothetical protein skT53_20740 [Effusibacillus dendaii]